MKLSPVFTDKLAEVLWHRQALRMVGRTLPIDWDDLPQDARDQFREDVAAILRGFADEGLTFVPVSALGDMVHGIWPPGISVNQRYADDGPLTDSSVVTVEEFRKSTAATVEELRKERGLKLVKASEENALDDAIDELMANVLRADAAVQEAADAVDQLVEQVGEPVEPAVPAFNPFEGLDRFEVSDQEKWRTWVTQNTDGYGRACIRFAARWASLVEKELFSHDLSVFEHADEASADIVLDNLKEASRKADTEGITGFMYGSAVAALVDSWRWGEVLRRWHNKEWGNPETEGVVNPAIITIGKAGEGEHRG